MKTVTLGELKKELNELAQRRLVELCVRLAKHKTENKELLGYLLFEAEDEDRFIEKQKSRMDEQFGELNRKTMYLAKKGLRKILRIVNKNIRFSGAKKTEVELIIYFCAKLRDSGISIRSSKMLLNLYQGQLARIGKALVLLHEDLQLDYRQEMINLEL